MNIIFQLEKILSFFYIEGHIVYERDIIVKIVLLYAQNGDITSRSISSN